MTIRPAGAADVPALSRMLAALSAEIGYDSPAAEDAAALACHGFGARPLFEALIAERVAQPVGLAVYFPEFSTFRRRPGVYVQDLYVAPEARGSGLGRRLIGAVLSQAASWQAVYLRLAVHDNNRDALAFYQRLGFQTDLNERAYWIEGTALEELAGTP